MEKTNCNKNIVYCSKRKVVDANCSNKTVNFSKGKVVEAICSNKMVNCSKGKMLEVNYDELEYVWRSQANELYPCCFSIVFG